MYFVTITCKLGDFFETLQAKRIDLLYMYILLQKREMCNGFPYWVLGEKLRDRVVIDNLIVLDSLMAPTDLRGHMLGDFLRPYRRMVNRNLLYVSICTAAAGCK